MTTELTTPITRIKSVPGETYELGGLFKNIYLGVDDDDENKLINYTLEDLYTELKYYFDNSDFIYYSSKEPTSSQIKIWFDTTGSKEEGTE